jgi:hypothetical protein
MAVIHDPRRRESPDIMTRIWKRGTCPHCKKPMDQCTCGYGPNLAVSAIAGAGATGPQGGEWVFSVLLGLIVVVAVIVIAVSWRR